MQLVTYDLAKHWLDHHNTNNRPFKDAAIKKYAAQMEREEWSLSRIAFYADGTLMDGQNRLAAVVMSQTNQWFDVLVGASRKEGITIDTGVKRSISDALSIKGAEPWMCDRKTVAMIAFINKYGPCKVLTSSTFEIEDFANANREWLQPIAEFMMTHQNKRGLTPAAYYTQLALALRAGEPFDDVIDFAECYYKGENYDPDRVAVTRLREFCIMNPDCWSHGSLEDSAKKVQRAIYAFIRREPLTKLYAPSNYIYELPRIR